VRNEDQRSRDYSDIADLYRPGHADFTFDAKYGARDYRGGGRSSARETVARVAAGVIAKKLIARAFGGEVLGYVVQVGDLVAEVDPDTVTLDAVEQLPDGSPNITRCPDAAVSAQMVELIQAVRKDQDSIGGVAEIVARNVPAGLGEPAFGKLKADLGAALFSLPAVLGVEYGIGFRAATMRGSRKQRHLRARGRRHAHAHQPPRRHAGGISSGMPIVLRAVVKPTSSLSREQDTVRRDGQAATIATRGRHDPCLLPRFVPMAEAMVAIVLADHWLRHQGQTRAF
jgi:chorismate synthase